MSQLITLGEYIIKHQHKYGGLAGDLNQILGAMRLAAKLVHREVNKAGIADIVGAVGRENVQGEAQQKLDVYANEKFKAALSARRIICGIASEEEESFVSIGEKYSPDQQYVVLIDPVDGSSNIDVNVSVGTIFSIYRRITDWREAPKLEDFLQCGSEQIAAGYIIFGSSTMLVLSMGDGVQGFTFDPSIGVFYLSHENMKTPECGRIYSINEGNYCHFPLGVKQYIKYCQGVNAEERRPYSSRYIGSLVADFHRNLLKGGVFIYPSFAGNPNGKLRLLYECNPMAYLIEQANGKASDGVNPILSLAPTSLHQRSPLFIGSKKMVETAEEFLREFEG